MEIEFDAEKDIANRAKHGLSLERARLMDLQGAVIIKDRRRDYHEIRYLAYGPIDGRLHVLWFTWRNGIVRAIGMRKANQRERKRYGRL